MSAATTGSVCLANRNLRLQHVYRFGREHNSHPKLINKRLPSPKAQQRLLLRELVAARQAKKRTGEPTVVLAPVSKLLALNKSEQNKHAMGPNRT